MELPELFFRTRDNGAQVFQVVAGERQRRMDMNHIATVNIKNGNIKAHGDHTLTADEKSAIKAWMDDRTKELAARALDDIERSIDHLNHVSNWAQTKATDEELEVFTDRLLLTIHDLRAVLVRKKADRLMAAQKAAE